jgi:hypothetical protein
MARGRRKDGKPTKRPIDRYEHKGIPYPLAHLHQEIELRIERFLLRQAVKDRLPTQVPE